MILLLKIFESFKIIDFPTAYIMAFTGAWFLVFLVTVVFVKPKNKDVYRIVGAIPVIHFLVFFFFNYTEGDFNLGFGRFVWFLIAALVYAVAGIVIANKEKVIRHVVITGILVFITFALSVFYISGIYRS